jgi:hypothetical protein
VYVVDFAMSKLPSKYPPAPPPEDSQVPAPPPPPATTKNDAEMPGSSVPDDVNV